MMRGLLWAAGLAIVAGCGGEKTTYQTTPVVRGDLTQLVTATGQLNPVTNVQVGSQISGTIAKLYVDFNSAVTAGQVVAQIDDATYRAVVLQAEADLANAAAALELAKVNAGRAQQLFESKLIPQSDFDQAQASLHQAEANVQLKTAALERARVDHSRCTIFSPVDGIVISRSVDIGQTVAASLSAPVLFQIANDLTKMQINASVAEADIGNIEEGQTVEFTVDAFPGHTFHGEVVQVRNSPITVQNVVTYDTIVGVSNPDLKLKPGMTANVSIIIAHRENALKIPNATLRYRPPDVAATTPRAGKKRESNPTRTVYVLAGNKAQPVQITTGISDGIHTEVLDGLKEGDAVITSSTSKQAAQQTQTPFSPGIPRRF